jgi:hypothetical protein
MMKKKQSGKGFKDLRFSQGRDIYKVASKEKCSYQRLAKWHF